MRWLLENPSVLILVLLLLVFAGGFVVAAVGDETSAVSRRLDRVNAWCARYRNHRAWAWWFGAFTLFPAVVVVVASADRHYAAAAVWSTGVVWGWWHWKRWATERRRANDDVQAP